MEVDYLGITEASYNLCTQKALTHLTDTQFVLEYRMLSILSLNQI